jgi:hypothetical protein
MQPPKCLGVGVPNIGAHVTELHNNYVKKKVASEWINRNTTNCYNNARSHHRYIKMTKHCAIVVLVKIACRSQRHTQLCVQCILYVLAPKTTQHKVVAWLKWLGKIQTLHNYLQQTW